MEVPRAVFKGWMMSDAESAANILAACTFYHMTSENLTREVAISDGLSRRQRQILEVLFELGEASAETVRARMPIAPSNSAARRCIAGAHCGASTKRPA